MKNKTVGYKGFTPTWECNGFQFKVGDTFEHKGKVKLCSSGFHFCENPLDIFAYYPPTGNFATIEADGVTDETESDSKRVAREIHIKAELTLHNLCKLGAKFILDRVDFKNAKESNTGDSSAATNTGYRSAATNTGYSSAATNTGYSSAATNTGYSSAATNTGDSSAATNTGYRSAATNTGDSSAATNTGYSSAATVEGKESIAVVTGKDSKAKGAKGCWIVLTERDSDWKIVSVKALKVDGKTVKADTFYQLQNGEAVEVQ
jgi:hypothetical protein